jgi:hypothetical protein
MGRPASPHGNPKPAQHRAFAAKDHTGIPVSNATGPAISCVRGGLLEIRGARWAFSAEALPTSTAACSVHQTTALNTS